MLCDGKSPCVDRLHPEVIMRGGRFVKVLYTIIKDSWKNLEVPADWKDAQLAIIFKKGDRQDYSNYHGISILSIPRKVFACILLNRLLTRAEDFLPEAQCGFHTNQGTAVILFSLQQIQENMPLYMFVNFTKAFDNMNKEAL